PFPYLILRDRRLGLPLLIAPPAHNPVNNKDDRGKNPAEEMYRPGYGKRKPFHVLGSICFRPYLSKHEEHDDDKPSGNSDTDISEYPDGHRSSNGGSGNIDDIIANEDSNQEPA